MHTTQTERQALNAAIDAGADDRATLTPADRRNLQRRLDSWELEHLRQLAKQQAEQIEQLTNELHDAQDGERTWQGLAIDRDHAEGPTQVGLTMAGELVAVQQHILTPISTPPGDMQWFGSACISWLRGADGHRFQRMHASPFAITWFGEEKMVAQDGRVWSRDFHAVVDDFGSLVEVPQ
mgnify:CR=1 FL=1